MLLKTSCSCQLKDIPLLGSTTAPNTSAGVVATPGAPGEPVPSYKTTEEDTDVPYSSPNKTSNVCTEDTGIALVEVFQLGS